MKGSTLTVIATGEVLILTVKQPLLRGPEEVSSFLNMVKSVRETPGSISYKPEMVASSQTPAVYFFIPWKP